MQLLFTVCPILGNKHIVAIEVIKRLIKRPCTLQMTFLYRELNLRSKNNALMSVNMLLQHRRRTEQNSYGTLHVEFCCCSLWRSQNIGNVIHSDAGVVWLIGICGIVNGELGDRAIRSLLVGRNLHVTERGQRRAGPNLYPRDGGRRDAEWLASKENVVHRGTVGDDQRGKGSCVWWICTCMCGRDQEMQ